MGLVQIFLVVDVVVIVVIAAHLTVLLALLPSQHNTYCPQGANCPFLSVLFPCYVGKKVHFQIIKVSFNG